MVREFFFSSRIGYASAKVRVSFNAPDNIGQDREYKAEELLNELFGQFKSDTVRQITLALNGRTR